MSRPDIVFVMTDQQRFDTIAALGNEHIRTPNLDRLVARGATFTNAYSGCPVCIPARYTIRTGHEALTTGITMNVVPTGAHAELQERFGPYLGSAMTARGYRTVGVGKFHTVPAMSSTGFATQLTSEEHWGTPSERRADAYASWIEREHPEYAWVEQLMGERTDMYYVPQMSPLPAELGQEAWVADRIVEAFDDAPGDEPLFAFASFIGPHPPFAPPIPFNRMYDPDRMPDPVVGDLAVDHLDQMIPFMNHAVYADDLAPALIRQLKARYYGEITYIDRCIGRILDAVERRGRAEDTLICFFADHGDHLGDHHAWQKESYFEASTRVPFLLSWPDRIEPGTRCDTIASLADLFALATGAAGSVERREGIDLLSVLDGVDAGRERLVVAYAAPGAPNFKVMVREDRWKLIWMANGDRTLLFDVEADPGELAPVDDPALTTRLRGEIVADLRRRDLDAAFDGEDLKTYEWSEWPGLRIHQFDESRGVHGFPDDPADLLG